MSIADKLTVLAASKEMVRLKLGIDEDVPFSEYGDHVGWDGITSDLGQSTTTAASQKLVTDREALLQTSITAILGVNKKLTNRINALEESNIYEMFNNSNGIWLDPSDLKTMFQDSAKTIPVTKDGDPVGLILDKSQDLAESDNIVKNLNFLDESWEGVAGSKTVTRVSDKIFNVVGTIGDNPDTGTGGLAKDVLEIGKLYNIQGSIKSDPSFELRLGSATVTVGANTTKDFNINIIANTSRIFFRGGAGSGNIEVLNLSIKEIKGNHASQPLAASRPTYRTDGVLHWLSFDGVDDKLDVNVAAANSYDISLSFNYLDIPTGSRRLVTYNGGSLILTSATNGNFNLISVDDGRLEDTDRRNQGMKVITVYTSNNESKYIGQSGEVINLPTGLARTVNRLTIGSNATFDVHGFIFKDSSQFYMDRSKQLHSYMQRKSGVEI